MLYPLFFQKIAYFNPLILANNDGYVKCLDDFVPNYG